MALFLLCAAGVFFPALVASKDPANGWLGYATGLSPTGQGRITFIEAYWTNCDNPRVDGAFFSPWFGIETSDNLNLIQPVNPWSGNHWEIYNEYFQWSPEHNENSRSHDVSSGDLIYGSVRYNGDDKQSYTVTHTDMNDNWSVETTIGVQQEKNGHYKNYTIAYFVFEKEARCDQYPPDDKVTFFNISVEWDGKKESPKWSTAYVDNVCSNRANIVDEATVEITWNSGQDSEDAEKVTNGEEMGLHGKRYKPESASGSGSASDSKP